METELEFDIKEELDNKFYHYDLGILTHALPDRNYTEINLCSYRVNVLGQHPFLQYLLLYNGNGELMLPKIYTQQNKDINGLLSHTQLYMSGISQITNFNEAICRGFYEYNDELYVFFDLTGLDTNANEIYLSSPIRFALIDEIFNYQHVCNIPIHENTVDFFTQNSIFNFLFDKNGDAYEHPIVAYVGKPTPDKLNFTSIFGESAKNKSDMFGAYYYFTNFNNAIRQGGWSRDYAPEYLYNKLVTDGNCGKYCKGGIVRFALFAGKTKYIENSLFVKEDDIESIKMKITDNEGLWANNYDSVCLGKIEVTKGVFLEGTPLIVSKEYEQQIPLSYHFTNKTEIGEKFCENKKYSIA